MLRPWHGIAKLLRRAAGYHGAGVIAVLLLGEIAPAATPPEASVRIDELRRQRKLADELATTIAADAGTFESAADHRNCAPSSNAP